MRAGEEEICDIDCDEVENKRSQLLYLVENSTEAHQMCEYIASVECLSHSKNMSFELFCWRTSEWEKNNWDATLDLNPFAFVLILKVKFPGFENAFSSKV